VAIIPKDSSFVSEILKNAPLLKTAVQRILKEENDPGSAYP